MKALVYDTVVCGKPCTCLHKFVLLLDEVKEQEFLEKEREETGRDLRYDDADMFEDRLDFGGARRCLNTW